MMINEKLLEKPDHGHYSVCLFRMNTIESYCRRCFFYTAAVCVLMLVLTIFTLRFNIISLIPNLFGDGTTVAANFVQSAILIGIVIIAGMATGSYKIFSVIIFLLYASMTVSCVFTDNFSDIFTFPIGAIGSALTFRSLGYYLDYVQLSGTEGFPLFNERLAEQEENSEYTPLHVDMSDGDNAMAEPSQAAAPFEFTGGDFTPEMEQLTEASASNEIPEISTAPARIYMPRHKKHCQMSESPQRLPDFK